MIPIVAGIAAAGPIANLFSNITQAVSKPNPAEFQQSLQHSPTVTADQAKIQSLLQGRSPSQLSVTEKQQLAQLLVGKTVQIINPQGQTLQGYVMQSQMTGTSPTLNLGNQMISLDQVSQIQVIA